MDKDSPNQICITVQQKKPLIITQNELKRIVHNSRSHENQQEHQETIREEHRQKLKDAKELAKELTKQMTRSKVAGSELKQRQYAKEAALAREELEVEARLLARKNRVLDKAYKRLFEQTDRVKYFKGAKNYAEMTKERDVQVAEKAAQQDLFAKYDAEFLVGQLRDVDKYNEEEEDKKRVMEDKKRINKANWTKQHEQILQKRKEEKRDNLREGYMIWNEVEQEQLKEKQKALNVRRENQNHKAALDHQIQNKCRLFDEHLKLDEAQEAKARLFTDFKRQVNLEHKKMKENLDREKDLKRQYVAENLVDASISRKTKEETNLQKAVREAEEKAKKKDAIKKLNREEAKKAFKEFYEKELSAKRRRDFYDRLKDYQEGRKLIETTEKLKKIEDSKIQRHGDLEKEAQHIQLHQIARTQVDRKAEEIEEIKEYMEHMRGLDDEEDMFQKYAQMEIANCESRGIDTFAMRKAARPGIECGKGPLFKDRGHIRPRYYDGRGIDLVHTSPVFWPQSGSIYQGSIKIQHLSSEAEYFGGVLTRKFSVKNPKGKTRTIKSFHLHGWRREEFVPPQVDTVVQLIAKVEKWTRKNRPAPIIVTCYDGCRASGFYCASSYLVGQIHETHDADVLQAVRTVRLHRPAFIPTVEQYRWLYEIACFLVSEKILK
ncbi:hypothetical protein JTE90_011804 [Oedothorax gibbosus]|uniref:Tyrosine specific protein phosphatases domain-containing protein n=1 Tax=Oedothorax gibbosus TaxID=931172 RepID=A0AAV6VU69_9ARAC|nr:hypothetical protein JTE90_011804 [Oedothorax gibbosus]